MSFNRYTQGFRFTFIFVIVFKFYFQNGMKNQINLDIHYPKHPISDHVITAHPIRLTPTEKARSQISPPQFTIY